MAVRIGVGMGLGGFPFESMREFHGWLDFCDGSGIDSIWHSDRVISREIALEPMTLLSVIAGATSRLKFGTNAVVLPFRDRRSTEFYFPWNFKETTFSQTRERDDSILFSFFESYAGGRSMSTELEREKKKKNCHVVTE